jgi:exodeoxyribonuclease VII large subunit
LIHDRELVNQQRFELEVEEDDGGNPTFSVRELAELLNHTLKRGTPDGVWVRGEIEGLQHARAGHVYFTLVERSAEGNASISVACFANTWTRLVRPALTKYRLKLENGLVVRIHGNPNVYAPSGKLSVVMDGFDARFTLGQLAADRDRLLRRLLADGLLDRNKAIDVPVLPLTIGVVTSIGSAAWHDFTHELEASGIAFRLLACDTRVQGDGSPERIAASIATVTNLDVDVVVVIRGGGSRTDLVAFDHELVARAIALSPVPVFTGLGHEIDRSIADEVAHRAFKTPTACAAHLVELVRKHATDIDQIAGRIAHLATQQLNVADRRLRDTAQRAAERTRRDLALAASRLDNHAARVVRQARSHVRVGEVSATRAAGRITAAGRRHVVAAELRLGDRAARLVRRSPRLPVELDRHLDTVAARISALDPVRTLARGYSITRLSGGAIVRSQADVAAGDLLVTSLATGEITSRVETL